MSLLGVSVQFADPALYVTGGNLNKPLFPVTFDSPDSFATGCVRDDRGGAPCWHTQLVEAVLKRRKTMTIDFMNRATKRAELVRKRLQWR